jgi:hypothetical protein
METLRKLWAAWKRFGQFLGDILARVVLTLFYFTVFVPFGLGVTLFSDPLRARRQAARGWLDREDDVELSIEEARGQF